MPFLFVALDYPDHQHAYHMVRQLDAVKGNFGYKLNLDFIVGNPSFYTKDLETKRSLFADMKMWNGVRTMTEVCFALQDKGFEFTNIHALCGLDMMRELSRNLRGEQIKVFGVTILTHCDDNYCIDKFGKQMELAVLNLVQDINSSGLFGAILPGEFEREAKKFLVHGKTLVPAVRPNIYTEKRKDQKQTSKIEDVLSADFLVCGSPITGAEDPKTALENILAECNPI